MPATSRAQWHCHNFLLQRRIDENGMVVDFTHIKQAITEKLDHHYLNDLIDLNPTAENLAFWISQQIPHCYKVIFQESEGNLACYVKPGFENINNPF